MKTLKELRNTKLNEMTGAEYEFFQRVTKTIKEKSEAGFFGMMIKGTKGVVLNAAEKFQRAAAETHMKDSINRLAEIKEEREDLKKLYTEKEISTSKYNLAIAELDVEEEQLMEP